MIGGASSLRRRAILCGCAALGALAIPATAARASGDGYGQIARARSIELRSLKATDPAKHPKVREKEFGGPALSATATSAPARRQAAPARSPAWTGAKTSTARLVSQFSAMSMDLQVQLLGNGQALTPPDTFVAAGPNDVVEVTNATISVWSKSGTRGATADLNVFFPVPSGYMFTDPRIMYDTLSSRWIATGLSFDANYNSQVYLAVSQTADPNGSWFTYTVASNNAGGVMDQPKVGLSDDKITLSWNTYQPDFIGIETYVLEKADALTGVTLRFKQFGPDATRFNLVPAQALSAGVTQVAVYNNPWGGSPFIGFVSITGTPANGNVAWNETDRSSFAGADPPVAEQPGGAPALDTMDTRFLNAVVRNGVLWTGGSESCLPSGDTTTRSCLHLVQAKTADFSLAQDFDVALAQKYLFTPAVTIDKDGNMIVVYTQSATNQYPSIEASGQPSGQTNSVVPGKVVLQGTASYNDSGASTPHGLRWGDYAGAAIDPSAPSDAWIAGEYGGAKADQGVWSTGIGRFTFALPASKPSITIVSHPASGTWGTAFSLTGVLAADGAGLGSKQVVVHRWLAGSSSKTDFNSTTDAAGNWKIFDKPARNATYQAVFYGDNDHQAATSQTQSVTVAVGIPTSVTSSVKSGTPAVFTGSVLPGHPGKRVGLQVLQASGKWAWANVTATLDSHSNFRLVYRNGSFRGWAVFRVAYWTQDTLNAGNAGRSVKVTWS